MSFSDVRGRGVSTMGPARGRTVHGGGKLTMAQLLRKGLIAYFKLEEASPADWVDSIRGLTLHRLNGANNTVAGLIGNGLRLLGSGDGGKVNSTIKTIDDVDSGGNSMTGIAAGNSGVQSGHDFTINFWAINMGIAGGPAVIISEDGSPGSAFNFQCFCTSTADNVVFYCQSSGTTHCTTPPVVVSTPTAWHMFTMGWDHTLYTKGGAFIMLDGANYVDVDAHAAGNDNGCAHGGTQMASTFCLGNNATLNSGIGNGASIMDEFAMWDRRLPNAQITGLFNSGAGLRPAGI